MTELRKSEVTAAGAKHRWTIVAEFVACLLVCTWLASFARANEELAPFRVDSLVFPGKVAERAVRPDRHQVSLIAPSASGIRAYDFRLDQETQEPTGEVTIYDASRQRYYLIDLPRRMRMEMAQDDVAQLVLHAHNYASRERGMSRVAASGKFEEEIWETPARLKLASPSLTYHTEIDASATPQAALAYQRFADAFARWNTVRTGLPPDARVTLNGKIASRRGVPKYVELTADFPGAGTISQHSRHVFVWQWTAADRQLVERFNAAMEEYRRVAPLEFLQATAPQAAQAKKR